MIFLTIGTQEPFDRLVRAMDQWAEQHAGTALFGQLGALKPDSYRPRHFPFTEFMEAADYDARLTGARLIVAHAGMGSIISALTNAIPIIIVPRRAALGEHRNEHQLATVERFRNRPGIHVADDETALGPLIDRLLASDTAGAGGIAPHAAPELIDTLRQFIHQRRP